jgi:hypothetical protein
MLPLGSVKGPKLLVAWFAESPQGTGLGSRNLPIKSSMLCHSLMSILDQLINFYWNKAILSL